jgi:hypothetical protein
MIDGTLKFAKDDSAGADSYLQHNRTGPEDNSYDTGSFQGILA